MISCPNCGSNPRFDIASQKLLCPHCGSSFDVETFPEEEYGADMQEVDGEYAGQPDKMKVTIYTCSQCGGELMSMDTDATAFCSYCGSHQILEERLSLQERPKRIIPFRITKEECKRIYGKKLKMSLLAPKALKDPSHIDGFRGIYMPYWSYNFKQNGTATFKGKVEHREGNYRIVDSYDLSVDEDNVYRGITHDASTSFDDKISESLAPFDTRRSVDFKTPYLSGLYADIPDLQKTVYQNESAVMAADETMKEVKDTGYFRQYSMEETGNATKISTTLTTLESADAAMFPVWFLSYRKDDRVAYAAINGQTGKMTADIPIDKAKYLIATGILAGVIWLILQTFNISSLRDILMTVIHGAMAGALIYGMVIYKLDEDIKNREWEKYMRERALKESGQKITTEEKKGRKNKKKVSTPKKENGSIGIIGTAIIWIILIVIMKVLEFVDFSWVSLAIPAVIAFYVYIGFDGDNMKKGRISNIAVCVSTTLGILIWLINPYVDEVYYFACVLMMICVVWCFFDALHYYNQLMTRPLPQFQKTGGDDRA